eukprot:1135989-Alexandrium_andersonii.AAC.1
MPSASVTPGGASFTASTDCSDRACTPAWAFDVRGKARAEVWHSHSDQSILAGASATCHPVRQSECQALHVPKHHP